MAINGKIVAQAAQELAEAKRRFGKVGTIDKGRHISLEPCHHPKDYRVKSIKPGVGDHCGLCGKEI